MAKKSRKPKKKSLYLDDIDSIEMNNDGLDFSNEIRAALYPIYQKYSKRGFSLRDIESLTMSEAMYATTFGPPNWKPRKLSHSPPKSKR